MTTRTATDWLEVILAREREAHRDFFDQEFDLTRFRTVLESRGIEMIQCWQSLGLDPHFLPQVAMARDVRFSGWRIKPCHWYYQQTAEGRILRRQVGGSLMSDKEAFRLEGIAVLVDTRLKPWYEGGKQMFESDNLLGPIIERLRTEEKITRYDYGSQSSRFGVSADEWENHIKPVLAEFLGVEVFHVRLERAIEGNIIPQLYLHMPRKGDGTTDARVWYEEYFEDASLRLNGGNSDYGGLARVNYRWANNHWRNRAPRPLVVLSN